MPPTGKKKKQRCRNFSNSIIQFMIRFRFHAFLLSIPCAFVVFVLFFLFSHEWNVLIPNRNRVLNYEKNRRSMDLTNSSSSKIRCDSEAVHGSTDTNPGFSVCQLNPPPKGNKCLMYSFGAGQKIGSLKFEDDILKGPLKDSECNFRIDKLTDSSVLKEMNKENRHRIQHVKDEKPRSNFDSLIHLVDEETKKSGQKQVPLVKIDFGENLGNQKAATFPKWKSLSSTICHFFITINTTSSELNDFTRGMHSNGYLLYGSREFSQNSITDEKAKLKVKDSEEKVSNNSVDEFVENPEQPQKEIDAATHSTTVSSDSSKEMMQEDTLEDTSISAMQVINSDAGDDEDNDNVTKSDPMLNEKNEEEKGIVARNKDDRSSTTENKPGSRLLRRKYNLSFIAKACYTTGE